MTSGVDLRLMLRTRRGADEGLRREMCAVEGSLVVVEERQQLSGVVPGGGGDGNIILLAPFCSTWWWGSSLLLGFRSYAGRVGLICNEGKGVELLLFGGHGSISRWGKEDKGEACCWLWIRDRGRWHGTTNSCWFGLEWSRARLADRAGRRRPQRRPSCLMAFLFFK